MFKDFIIPTCIWIGIVILIAIIVFKAKEEEKSTQFTCIPACEDMKVQYEGMKEQNKVLVEEIKKIKEDVNMCRLLHTVEDISRVHNNQR